jgi:hypothetical protein
MNTDNTIASFITGYGPELRGMICFAWNQKHAAEFHDENDVFRQQVIAAVLAEPYKAGLDLVGDLFEAEAHWSKEAWCIRNSFSKLGSILLRRGGAAQLDRFLEWFAVSFDAYSECHAMSLDPTQRPDWPESFWLLQNGCPEGYTLEAPSDWPLPVRAKALQLAVQTAVQRRTSHT